MQLFSSAYSGGDIKQHVLFSNTPECDAPFQSAGVAGSTCLYSSTFSVYILTLNPPSAQMTRQKQWF
jgi:hypothetical protein